MFCFFDALAELDQSSTAVTCGSVGDITSINFLVKDVLDTLDDARGSAAEYQTARQGLLCFDRALLQVGQLKGSTNDTPQLHELHIEIEEIAKEGRMCIEEFHDRLRKYGTRLDVGGSGNTIKNVTRKLEWKISGKVEERERFQRQISGHTQALNLLLSTAGM